MNCSYIATAIPRTVDAESKIFAMGYRKSPRALNQNPVKKDSVQKDPLQTKNLLWVFFFGLFCRRIYGFINY